MSATTYILKQSDTCSDSDLRPAATRSPVTQHASRRFQDDQHLNSGAHRGGLRYDRSVCVDQPLQPSGLNRASELPATVRHISDTVFLAITTLMSPVTRRWLPPDRLRMIHLAGYVRVEIDTYWVRIIIRHRAVITQVGWSRHGLHDRHKKDANNSSSIRGLGDAGRGLLLFNLTIRIHNNNAQGFEGGAIRRIAFYIDDDPREQNGIWGLGRVIRIDRGGRRDQSGRGPAGSGRPYHGTTAVDPAVEFAATSPY